jgi:hypothetical protein
VTFQIKIGTFGDDDAADISVDGKIVGWLERVRGERFASASSRARVSFVSHYSRLLTNDEIIDVRDALLAKGDVATLSVADQNLHRDCDIALGIVRCKPETREEARARVTRAAGQR